MKKFLTSLLIAITVSTAVPTQKSHAIIGTFSANYVEILGGLGIIAAGTGLVALGDKNRDDVLSVAGAFVIVFGIIMLDGEDGQSLEFNELDSKDAQKLGVTQQQIDVYNSEIDEANIILEQVTLETESIDDLTKEQASKVWLDYKDYVSTDTFKVMQVLASQI